MRTAINPITARMVQIIFGHLLLSGLTVRTRPGWAPHISGVRGFVKLPRARGFSASEDQHSLFARMQFWMSFFKEVWFQALKKSACIV
jgi:hypothetical protein